jgi:hypothetical protein
MLPDFDENGNLPPGIHRATIEEVAARFGQGSDERRVETKELIRFVDWARRAFVQRVLVNGSYVTDSQSPADVDIVILPSIATLGDPQYGQFGDLAWPFLHIFVAVDELDFERWGEEDFATSRRKHRKGVVELVL